MMFTPKKIASKTFIDSPKEFWENMVYNPEWYITFFNCLNKNMHIKKDGFISKEELTQLYKNLYWSSDVNTDVFGKDVDLMKKNIPVDSFFENFKHFHLTLLSYDKNFIWDDKGVYGYELISDEELNRLEKIKEKFNNMSPQELKIMFYPVEK